MNYVCAKKIKKQKSFLDLSLKNGKNLNISSKDMFIPPNTSMDFSKMIGKELAESRTGWEQLKLMGDIFIKNQGPDVKELVVQRNGAGL